MPSNRTQILDRMRAARDEMERIANLPNRTADDDRRFNELSEQATLDAVVLRAMDGSGDTRVVGGVPDGGGDNQGRSPELMRTVGDPWDPNNRADLVSRARTAIDRATNIPDHGRQRLTVALDTAPDEQLTPLARWAAATSDPAYAAAFSRMLRDPQLGYSEFSEDEREAWRRVREVSRAMGIGTGAGGGFMVPTHLDPAIMLTSDGSISPLRQIARVETIATDTWNGVSSAGVTGEWLAEASEAADGSPTLAQPSIPVHKGSAFVPFSVEFEGDGANALEELRRLLADAADQLQAEAYAVGTGTGQPTGVVNVAAGSQVATATADALVAADVFGLQNVLPPRFQARAQWATNLATANEIQQFETAAGAKVFPEIANGQLLRKPWNELSFLDAAGDTATAGNDNVAVYGDFAAGFVIVDRVGTTLEIVQHLVGTNRRPTGQRGAWLWFRTGSDVVNDSALRVLTA